MQRATSLERRVDAIARRLLRAVPTSGFRAGLAEFLVFVLKQAWACVFGAALLVVIVAARLWYPDDAALARNDALTIAAVLIQVAMLVFRLESVRELWVIVLFHITGTAMELFKTDVGSWAYAADGILRIGESRCSAGSCTRRSAPTWCACTGCSTSGSPATRAGG